MLRIFRKFQLIPQVLRDTLRYGVNRFGRSVDFGAH